MARGVYNLSQVKRKSLLNQWDSVDNVWVFPDNDGSEFKYVDGTVTPAPAATPSGITTAGGITSKNYGIINPPSTDPNFGHKIVSRSGKVAIASNKKVYLYDLSENILQESTNNLPTLKLELTIDPAASSTIQDIALNSNKIFIGVSTAVYRYDFDGTNQLIIPGSVSAIDASETHIVVGRDSSTKSAVITTVNGTSPVTLTPSLPGSTNTYGYAVGISTNRVVVGDHNAYYAFINGSQVAMSAQNAGGAAYLYDLSGTEIAKLDRGDEVVNPNYDRFGYSIEVNPITNTVYVGSPNEYGTNESQYSAGRGAIFCFELTTGGLTGKYSRHAVVSQDARIGASIAVNKETPDAVLYYTAGGDYSTNTDSSLYSRRLLTSHLSLSTTSNWQPASAASMDETNRWGWDIEATASKLISNDNKSAYPLSNGAVKYIYVHNHDGSGEIKWTSSHNPGNAGDNFAASFKTDGTKIVVGADRATVNSIAESGRAYIYNMNGTGEISLQPSGTQPSGTGWGRFGTDVAIGPIKGSNGARRIVVGAPYYSASGGDGAIFIFNDSGTEVSRFIPADQELDEFGTRISIQSIEDGGNIIISGRHGWFILDPETNTILKRTVWRNTTIPQNSLVNVWPQVLAKNGYIIIGNYSFNYSNNPHLSGGSANVGRVDVFDKDGNEQYVKWPPGITTYLLFGWDLEVINNTLYVGTRAYHTGYDYSLTVDALSSREKVLAYNLSTGDYLYDLTSPNYDGERRLHLLEGFGASMAVANNTLFVTNAGNTRTDGSTYTKNTVYKFTSTGFHFQENTTNSNYVQSNNQFARSIGISTVSTSLTQQLDTPYDNGGIVFVSDTDSVRFYGRKSATSSDIGPFSDIYHYRQPVI